MAKRKKQSSKVQKKKGATAHPKAKKAAAPIAAAVETVEVIEQPAPAK
jgi:hypothetical protein